ncbi:hypothetical protein BC938DRAFT_480943 [Jimgerdemannia flammicorona]|uniref:Nitric oxide synthase-interacting protein zinc-finger domain-containing protein n=1 Tax=Jimgerdemannia flammicorona TaxID=994334 RepID=A0A433QHF0_9FUNG|nr:hypothetical protein BC938DRAFT_480943 [Jimgerdemannia flammicorona]
MPRHSKNNTASSVFTYHESHILEYGTKKQRLGRDSFRDFDACHLCLQRARDPVCCPQGHLSCRECALENILAQKKETQRQLKLLEAKRAEEDEDRRRKEDAAREAVITDFEKAQTRLLPEALKKAALGSSTSALPVKRDVPASSASPSTVTPKGDGKVAGQKRKFELSEEEVLGIAEREKEEAMRKLEEARAEGAKAKLPAFWLPSLTPAADNQVDTPKVKAQTICTATKEEHPISIKTLISAKFAEEATEGNANGKGNGNGSGNGAVKKSYACPACRKTITNSLRILIREEVEAVPRVRGQNQGEGHHRYVRRRYRLRERRRDRAREEV